MRKPPTPRSPAITGSACGRSPPPVRRRGGTSLGPDAVTRFVVDPRDLELDNPAADPALLADLGAATTGGSVVPPEGLPAFLADVGGGAARTASESTVLSRTPLYDRLVGPGGCSSCLMGAEWFLRKKRGLV